MPDGPFWRQCERWRREGAADSHGRVRAPEFRRRRNPRAGHFVSTVRVRLPGDRRSGWRSGGRPFSSGYWQRLENMVEFVAAIADARERSRKSAIPTMRWRSPWPPMLRGAVPLDALPGCLALPPPRMGYPQPVAQPTARAGCRAGCPRTSPDHGTAFDAIELLQDAISHSRTRDTMWCGQGGQHARR